jgi:hypothetical protein
MDVSVSRLNNRLALQVPAELPLGLVFVTGTAANVQQIGDGHAFSEFDLLEEGHCLRCRLTPRASLEVQVSEGNVLRVGGHLAFDARRAHYYLLARDVEILQEARPGRPRLAPILGDARRREALPSLAPAELPPWVSEIAPPEVREALTVAPAPRPAKSRATPPVEPPPPPEPPATDMPSGLNNEMVAYLSEAIDSREEIEVTPELMARWQPARPTVVRRSERAYLPVRAPRPSRSHWLIAIIAVLVVLTILTIFAVLAYMVLA